MRAIAKIERRLAISARVIAAGGIHRGLAAQIAREFGVTEATISRDLKAILAPPINEGFSSPVQDRGPGYGSHAIEVLRNALDPEPWL